MKVSSEEAAMVAPFGPGQTPFGPGRTPGQQNLHRLQEQQREQQQERMRQGWWYQQRAGRRGRERASGAPPRRADELGFFPRLVRGLLLLVLSLAWVAALAVAVLLVLADRAGQAVVAVAVAVVAFLVARGIRGWGSRGPQRAAGVGAGSPPGTATLQPQALTPGERSAEERAWYVADDGRQSGPLTRSEVVERIQRGELTIAGFVFGPGTAAWVPAGMHPEFAGLFGPAATRATSTAPPAAPAARAPGFAVSRSIEERAEGRAREPEQPPPVRPAGPRSVPRRFRHGRRGVVREVQIREVSSTEYLSFRLERTDAAGNVVEQIPVEMRGNIPGRVLRDGDEVIVLGRRHRYGIRPRAVYVLGTESVIRPRRYALVVLAVVLALVGAVLVLAANNSFGGVLLVLAVLLGSIGIWRNR